MVENNGKIMYECRAKKLKRTSTCVHVYASQKTMSLMRSEQMV